MGFLVFILDTVGNNLEVVGVTEFLPRTRLDTILFITVRELTTSQSSSPFPFTIFKVFLGHPSSQNATFVHEKSRRGEGEKTTNFPQER